MKTIAEILTNFSSVMNLDVDSITDSLTKLPELSQNAPKLVTAKVMSDLLSSMQSVGDITSDFVSNITAGFEELKGLAGIDADHGTIYGETGSGVIYDTLDAIAKSLSVEGMYYYMTPVTAKSILEDWMDEHDYESGIVESMTKVFTLTPTQDAKVEISLIVSCEPENDLVSVWLVHGSNVTMSQLGARSILQTEFNALDLPDPENNNIIYNLSFGNGHFIMDDGVLNLGINKYMDADLYTSMAEDQAINGSALREILGSAKTDTNISYNAVSSILSRYGSTDALNTLAESILGEDVLSSTSVLALIGQILDRSNPEYHEGDNYYTPRSNPRFIANVIGAIISVIVATVITVLSIIFHAIAAILAVVIQIVSVLFTLVTENVKLTSPTVSDNLTSMPGIGYYLPIDNSSEYEWWGDLSDSDKDYLYDRLCDEGLLYIPIGPVQPGKGTGQWSANNVGGRCGLVLFPTVLGSSLSDTSITQMIFFPMLEGRGDYYRFTGFNPSQTTAYMNNMSLADCNGICFTAASENPEGLLMDSSEYNLAQMFAKGLIDFLTIMANQFGHISPLNPAKWAYQLNSSVPSSAQYGVFFGADSQNVVDSLFNYDIDDYAGLQWKYGFPQSCLPGGTYAITDDQFTATKFYLLAYALIQRLYEPQSSSTSSDVWAILPAMANNSSCRSKVSEALFDYMHSTFIDIANVSIRDFILPGKPVYQSGISYPTIGKAGLTALLAMLGVTAAIGAGVAVGVKVTAKRRAVKRLSIRENEFEKAKEAYASDPSSRNLRSMARANRRLSRAWVKAGKANLSMYNGFSCSDGNSSETPEKAKSLANTLLSFGRDDGGTSVTLNDLMRLIAG